MVQASRDDTWHWPFRAFKYVEVAPGPSQVHETIARHGRWKFSTNYDMHRELA